MSVGQVAFFNGVPAFGWKLFDGASINKALLRGVVVGGGSSLGYYALEQVSATKEWDDETKKIAVYSTLFFITVAAYYTYNQIDPNFNYQSELRSDVLALVVSCCFGGDINILF